MQKLMSAMAVVALASPTLLLGQAGDAGKVLADMQAALGGSDHVAAVSTLTMAGVIRRVTPRGTIERTVEIAMALPDKYVARTQLTDQGNMSVYRNLGFNGDGLINVTDAPPNLAAAGRDRMRTDRPMVAQTEAQQADVALRQLLTAKSDFARLTLALLGASYEGFPLQFSYAGLAESPDGSAHVIGARGADGFEARLFVDRTTSLPLMMMWSQALPRDPETMQEHRLYFSDFRSVDGLRLPHTVRRSVDGNVTEETTYTEIAINPEIDPKMFEISR